MSLASTASTPAWELAMSTTTVRQFGKALLVALAALLAGCGIYLIESRALQLDRRFIENPADVIMRAFALAHFVVGLLYLLSSPRIRNPQSALRLAIATVAGVAVCLAFAQYGSMRNPLLVMLFYGSFLLHEVRDEAQLYQAYGDSPRDAPVLRSLCRTAVLVLMAGLALSYVLHIEITNKQTALDRGPDWLAPTVVAGVFALALLAAGHTWHAARRCGTTLRAVIIAHMPLVLVYGGILCVLLVGSLLGSTGLNMIILIHVSAWLVFVYYQLSKKRAEVRGVWSWLRSTPAGFLVLHLGIMLLMLGLMAVRVHVWQRVGIASELLSSKAFVYWALMHIVMAFGGPK